MAMFSCLASGIWRGKKKIAYRRLVALRHAKSLQILLQLGWITHQNCSHAYLGGAFNIRRAIVDKTALVRRLLNHVQRHAIYFFVRLAHAYVTRAYEQIANL